MICSIYKDQLALYDCFKYKDVLKDEYGAKWDSKEKAWLIPFNIENLKKIRDAFNPQFDESVVVSFKNKQKCIEFKKKIANGTYQPSRNFHDLIINANLMQHQILAANFACDIFENGGTGVMFSMEMGTGKTLSAMTVVGEMKPKKVLIICPKVAMKVWDDEYYKFARYDYLLRVLSGTPQKRIKAMNELLDNKDSMSIAVINYEYVSAFENILLKWQPDMIICDESHKIKSPSSNQTKSIIKIGRDARYKLCLTGTPLTNNILDFFSQYKFLDSSIFGESYTNYKAKYVITGVFNEYLRPNPRTFGELKEKIDSIAYRVTKEECLDLPPFVDIPVYVEMNKDARKKYIQFEDEFIVWLDNQTFITADNALTQTLKLRQLTGGFCYNEEQMPVFIDNSKIEACSELVSEIINAGNKVVIFAEFQAEIKALKEMCDKLGIKSGTYYGATKEKDRNELVDGFQNGDIQVFIGQIESAGISITLTSANYMIFYSTGYKYGVYDQARARIHRKGQNSKCTYYHLIIKDTIDEKIVKSLNKKERLAQSVIDSYRRSNERR